MGGNAIEGAKRIPKEEYVQLCHELQELFPELKMKPVKAYRQKPDFGDIDIVVETSPYLNIPELVLNRLGPDLTHYHNNMFFSFEYKGVQVDFISMSPDIFIPALSYFAWNDLGNFIGRTARSINFKYGHEGLMYELRLGDHYKKAITVSTDVPTILEFLGYDSKVWEVGFDTEEEIFAYAASSTIFNALYFDLDEQGHNDRVRNRKRKMYQKMLQYIEDKGIEPRPKLTEEERKESYDRAREVFGDYFHNIVVSETAKYEKGLKFKEVYNGDIVASITNLKGKELGAFMNSFKRSFGLASPMSDPWDKFIDIAIDKGASHVDYKIHMHMVETFARENATYDGNDGECIFSQAHTGGMLSLHRIDGNLYLKLCTNSEGHVTLRKLMYKD